MSEPNSRATSGVCATRFETQPSNQRRRAKLRVPSRYFISPSSPLVVLIAVSGVRVTREHTAATKEVDIS